MIAPLTLGPVVPGSTGLTRADVRNHVLVGLLDGSTGTGDAVLIMRGRPTRVIREAPASARAVPDGSWGAAIESDDEVSRAPGAPPRAIVTAGPVGDDGEVGEGTVVVKGAIDAVLGAIGTGANRAVLVRYDEPKDPLAIVRSTDGGATRQKPARIPGSGFAVARADRVAGALDVTWDRTEPGDDPDGLADDEPHAFWWHLTDATAAPRPVALPFTGIVFGDCGVDGAMWFHDDGLRLATADGVIHTVDGAGDIRACTKAAVATVAGTRVFRCTAQRCDAGMEVRTPEDQGMSGATDVFDVAGVIYAQQAAGAIAIWRTGVDPVFVRPPPEARLVAVVSWGKQQYLALTLADGLHVAPVP